MIFLDIETLDFFNDPHIARLPRPAQLIAMRFGLAITYDSETGRWQEWSARDLCALWQTLIGQTIVGWNIFDFDLPLLMLHLSRLDYDGDPWLDPLTCIDLMDLCKRASRPFGTDRWYKLHDSSMATLGHGKTADGQQAAEWLRSGDPVAAAQAAAYCRADVQLTIDLFAAAQTTGLLLPARPARGEQGDLRLWLTAEGQIKDCQIVG